MDSNEIALLELLAIKPISFFPPQPYMIARRLARRGLVAFKDGHWYPTAEGIEHRIGSMKSSNDQAFAKPTR